MILSPSSPYDFRLPSVSGETVSLDDYRPQRGVVVIFTCNHCPYAIATEDRIIALHQRFAPLGFPVLAISSNDAQQYPQDGFEAMKARAAEKGFPFPYLYDETQEVARAFGAERTPHVFLLQPGQEGWRAVYRGSIDDSHRHPAQVQERYLEAVLERLSAGEAAPFAETPAVGCSIKWKIA
jgi:peroxiredoxin